MSAVAALHRALYTRLSTAPALATYKHASMPTAGVKVYDHVPSVPGYPYVSMGDPTEAPANTLGNEGHANTVTLHVWDNYQGSQRINEVFALLTTALREPLAVEGFGTMRAKYDFGTVLRDPSGLRHGVYRVRRLSIG